MKDKPELSDDGWFLVDFGTNDIRPLLDKFVKGKCHCGAEFCVEPDSTTICACGREIKVTLVQLNPAMVQMLNRFP